jgi:hypothetical protein
MTLLDFLKRKKGNHFAFFEFPFSCLQKRRREERRRRAKAQRK